MGDRFEVTGMRYEERSTSDLIPEKTLPFRTGRTGLYYQ
jgi:hypothetical protein